MHRSIVVLATAAMAVSAHAQTLWYRQPAQKWATEALPIGNGRLGAMLFGGVQSERIQFNENTLWGGANNWDGGYDLSDTGFGGYRNFGDLFIDCGAAANPEASSPSGHAKGNGQGIEGTTDSNPATKWCIENPGQTVVWEVTLPAALRVPSYALTSASDVPARDPQAWTLDASQDGQSWTTLDQQTLPAPFAQRGETRSFAISKPEAFRFYRLMFTPPAGATHFQVAEIALAGVKFAAGNEVVPADYRRSLDITTGLHRVAFTAANGAKITREAFASHPAQTLIFRYQSNKPGALSGRIRLKPAQSAATVTAGAAGITLTGSLANQLRYAGALRVQHDGGSVTPAANGTLAFANCNTLTLLLNARTNYQPSFAAAWRGAEPLPLVQQELAAAAATAYPELRAAHVADITRLLGTGTLTLGGSTAEQAALPTDERIARYVDRGKFTQGGDDPELAAATYQMGRYLLASSSRPGGLPANLQGLWNDSNQPAWASDYHNNINIQMNYWPAETTGLASCAEPLVDFIIAQAEPCRLATRKAFGQNTRGWTARTSQSPFGGNGWEWNIPASAWYALHVFDHWDFSRDDAFLRDKAYPILKEICQYWEDRLKPLPDGTLVAHDGWSPEHGPREDGVMHDQQLIWELFDDYLRAAKALGADPDYQAKIAGMQRKLAPNKIGKWGQLQEWQTDRDDPHNRHRHTSHLFALYPGRQISKTGTPELAKAARVSLLARSNDTSDQDGRPWTPADMHPESIYGWVWPWRAAMWARLGEAERAHALIWGKHGNSAPNMLGLNTPHFTRPAQLIQLDNSFGATAAIAEMLLQSHAGEIQLLPALPTAWAKDGSFTGLRARGGFAVDCAWQNGQLTKAVLHGKPGTQATVRYRDRLTTVTLPPSGQAAIPVH